MIKHLYIHIPFCKHICKYCDFPKRVSSIKFMEEYRNALLREIEINSGKIKNVNTIFIGGGTPSFFPFLEDIIKKVSEFIDLERLEEFTVESTPDSINNLIPLIKRYHISRISIGLESRCRKTLEYIGRKYQTFEELKLMVDSIRNEGVRSLNIDMIHSLPFETKDSLREGIDEIARLGVDHVSYYDLIMEDKTILSYEIEKGIVSLPSEDESIEMMDIVEEGLESLGFEKYEISNFSKKGFESVHNLSYWKLDEYIGLGASAHSQYDGKRYSNPAFSCYLTIDKENYEDIREYYDFDPRSEYFLLGLRMTNGVSIDEYKKMYLEDPIERFNLERHIKCGLLEMDGEMIRFTKKGMRIGNIVFEEFV